MSCQAGPVGQVAQRLLPRGAGADLQVHQRRAARSAPGSCRSISSATRTIAWLRPRPASTLTTSMSSASGSARCISFWRRLIRMPDHDRREAHTPCPEVDRHDQGDRVATCPRSGKQHHRADRRAPPGGPPGTPGTSARPTRWDSRPGSAAGGPALWCAAPLLNRLAECLQDRLEAARSAPARRRRCRMAGVSRPVILQLGQPLR